MPLLLRQLWLPLLPGAAEHGFGGCCERLWYDLGVHTHVPTLSQAGPAAPVGSSGGFPFFFGAIFLFVCPGLRGLFVCLSMSLLDVCRADSLAMDVRRRPFTEVRDPG